MEPRKSGGAISWADEVEKEEEAAKFQIKGKQKQNPYGSATRPREVILRERGINLRKIDQPPFASQKEKPLQENIPAPISHVFHKKPKKPENRSSPKHKLGSLKVAAYQYKGSQVPQTYDGEFVPPVRYPPKNLIPYLFPPTQAEPYNHRTGQFLSFSTTDHGRRDNHFKGCHNQHTIELEMKITSKKRNTFR